MIRKTHMAELFLLSSHLLSVCSVPQLSTIHEINMRGKQKEQIIMRKGENTDKRGTHVDEDARQEVDVSSSLILHYLKWRKIDEGTGPDLLKRVHSLLSPHSHLVTMPVRGRKVGIKWNVYNINTTHNANTPPPPPPPAADTTTTTTTTSTTISMTDPFIFSPLYTFPSLSLLPSPSCSSSACKWVASWQFLMVVCLTLAWLVALTALCCITRTSRGKLLLEACSSLCIENKKNQNEVLTKGIGYFDGSPGLRRFVLIEDEREEEDKEDNGDDPSTSESNDVRNKGNEEAERGEYSNSRNWKPPRRGVYIIHEASKKGVLEVGMYRLQEEEEEEVDGKKRKKEEKEEKEVEYILEGPTYILQSERVGRGVEGIGERGAYGHIGEIEGLYGIVGREGGYGRIWGSEAYEIMGRRGGGGIGGGRYDRVGGLEELYDILQNEITGGDDGVLLSLRELVDAVGAREREDSIRGGGRTGAEGEEWREGEERGDTEGEQREGREEGRDSKGEERGREISGEERGKVDEKGRERDGNEREQNISDKWGGRWGRIGISARDRNWGGRTPPTPKRAASFPMDHFLSSHIMPRKLSLIVEE